MLKASEARALVTKSEYNVNTDHFIEEIGETIVTAARSNLTSITIDFPPYFEAKDHTRTKRYFSNLGYKTRLETKGGAFGGDIVVMPKTYITLSW